MVESMENRADAKLLKRLLPWLLALICLLIALVFVLQSLLTNPPPAAAATQIALPSERAPLLLSLRAQQPIFWSSVIGAVALLLALLVAASPLTWWMRLWAAFGWGPSAQLARMAVQHQKQQQEQQAMDQWIAEQAVLYAEQTQTQAFTPPNAPAPGVQAPDTPQPVGGQPPNAQTPGTQIPGTPQPGAPGTQPAAQTPGTPQPGTILPQPGMPPGAQPGTQPSAQPEQPGAPQPPAPQTPGAPAPVAPPSEALQALLVEEEKLDLAELTDIGDLLSSFKESEGVSPQLLALSQSLDEVDVTILVAQTRQLAATLAAGKRR